MDWLHFSKMTAEFNCTPSSYSGRAMYGQRCVSVVVENFAVFAAGLVRAAADLYNGDELCDILDNIAELFDDARTDNMGRDMVIYWPGWEWLEEYDNECVLED